MSSMEQKEPDRYLPIANIGRIMKKALPENAKIARESKEAVQECVSEFISFITSEACDKCKSEKRKTINGDDLLFAMDTLGFENYIEPLKLYLQKFRESTKQAEQQQLLQILSTSQNNEPISQSQNNAASQEEETKKKGDSQENNDKNSPQ